MVSPLAFAASVKVVLRTNDGFQNVNGTKVNEMLAERSG